MISTINIKNIGIIDNLSIDLNQGFNVLTGETGAGKTLIIDSLAIISGGRFSKEMIRQGENYSYIEACIYMPENENSIDGNIIVSREIYSNGRNSCKINGRLVTVSELKEFMKDIIDIHGQNDNQTILDKASHIGIDVLCLHPSWLPLLFRPARGAHRCPDRRLSPLHCCAKRQGRD